MNTYLIYPPFADPTQPYGALPVLKGYLNAKGLHATVVDLNVSAAHRLLDPKQVRAAAEKIADRFLALNGRPRLSVIEQMEYLSLTRARAAALRFLSANIRPVDLFRQRKGFYDIKRYIQARNLAEDALTVLRGLHFPFHFHFNQASHVAVPWGIELLERYFKSGQSPLEDHYRSVLSAWRLQPGDVVGLSLTFISQIPETFYLLQLIRRLEPRVFTVLGGSCLQQILCHAPESTRRWIVTMADAACAREGEEALAQLLTVLAACDPMADERTRYSRLLDVPNLLMREPGTGRLHNGPPHQTDLGRLPEPDFSDLKLDQYLAPEPTVLFAPTRGCYWNKCSFCDYGLNRTGLHGYREIPAAEAARQLMAVCRRTGVRHVYLSVDVLSPKYAEALARELIALRADILWSTDLRIDPYYTEERCALLFESGLRAVAFGVESGSDRLLTLMHKGITSALIREVNAHFHRAGIATAWMTFSDHPGESAAEALETVRLIESERAMTDLFILGRFGLTSGADIFAHPRQYGIKQVYYCRGDDFRLFPLFTPADAPARKTNETLEKQIAGLSKGYYLDHYPWAGAISTHHSLLYFIRYGQEVFRRLRRPGPPKRGPRPEFNHRPAEGVAVAPTFDVTAMEIAQQRFFESFWSSVLSPGRDGTAPLNLDLFISRTEAPVI